MKKFRERSIKAKLMVAIMATSITALILASAVLVASDLLALRQAMTRNITVLADALSMNSRAALSFASPRDAEDTLLALRADAHILAAALYDGKGHFFAGYTRDDDGSPLPRSAGVDGHRFEDDSLIVVRPVVLDQKRIGTILLRADLEEMYGRIQLFLYVGLVALLASLILTLAMSNRFQQAISGPILELAGTARVVTDQRDYSVRARRRSTDEIGSLTDAFNDMLNSIQEREGALKALNETLEQRVAERTAAAEEANRAKSKFLANMSHELRTPLNSVIGFTNLMLKNKAGNMRPEDINFLQRILANGRHLLGLINQILDLSKIEARRMELQSARVDLGELVRETVAQQEGQIRERPVRLVCEIPASLMPILSDPDKLRQVLINLVGNALKFTEKGSVTVRILTRPGSGFPVRIDVEDTGIGIPPEKQESIFDAFRQADGGIARKFGGTGLGLTISRALCQLMGFTLTLSSEPGRGSTFSIGLESATAAPPGMDGALPAVAAAQTDLRGRHVLVVDDEADARMLLGRLIEEMGCRVTLAESGERALQLARELHPDLITLDLMMPGMNGRKVLASLREDPAMSTIPVIVVSVVAGENQGINFGVVDFIDKPGERETLRRAIKRNIRQGNGRVLIVEDNPSDRAMLERTLGGNGLEFRLAASGGEGLETLRDFRPDVIVLDLMMPGMDGVEFLDRLRAMPGYQHVPVIVATAKELSAEERAKLDVSVLSVLHKANDFEHNLQRQVLDLLTPAATGRQD